jgi:RNA recognition motif-containing protein
MLRNNKYKHLSVGNIPESYKEDSLTSLFSDFGRLMRVCVMKDVYTGKSKGFAFVKFEFSKSATNALEHYRGKEVDCRVLKLTISRGRNK